MESDLMGSIHIPSVTDGQLIERTFHPNSSHDILLSLMNPLDQIRELSLHWDASHDLIDRLIGTVDAKVLSVHSLTFSYISHLNET